MNQTMIIVWKWEDLYDQNKIDPHFPVYENPDWKVVRINERRSESAIKDLAYLINENQQKGDLQVFLHKDHGYSSKDFSLLTQQISDSGSSVKYFLFGGGDDFIYYAHSEAGLLDDFGGFMDEPEYEYRRIGFDGTVTSGIEKVCVFRKNLQSGKEEILPYFFRKVWDYYQNDFTRKIYNLKQQFFNEVYPFYLNRSKGEVFSLNQTLRDNHSNLLNEISVFCQPENLEMALLPGGELKYRDNYIKIKNILIQKVLNNTKNQNTLEDLVEIRAGFNTLLSELEH